MRDQDFKEQQAQASAQDVITNFNTQQSILARSGNVDREMLAAGTRQELNEKIANRQEARNKQESELQKEKFKRDTEVARGITELYKSKATAQDAQGKSKSSKTAGIIGGIGKIASIFSDKNMKTNVSELKEFDVNEFLNNITGYKYNYKDQERYGEGPQTGVMAQDLEKSKMGSEMVDDTPEGKSIDIGKLSTGLAASVSELHERLKQLEGKVNGKS